MNQTTQLTKRVRKVLLDLGLRRPVEHSRYLSNIKSRFGDLAESALDEIDKRAAGDTEAEIYHLKNRDPDLSLAIASQGFYPVYEAFLTWLIRRFPDPPTRILDLGCEAGVLSLAIAEFWPDTEIVGIDREPAAIEVARELKTRHNSDNCTFHVADIADLDALDHGEFDLILAVLVFHEFLGDVLNEANRDLGFSIDETPDWKHGREETLRSLASQLQPEGLLIAVNRWVNAARTLQWLRTMEEAGWSTHLNGSHLLQTTDRHKGMEKLPITVHHWNGEPYPSQPDDALALHSYPDFSDQERFSFEDESAAAVRRALGEPERVLGAEVDYYDGSGVERLELLAAGPTTALYHSSSRGYRRLLLGSLASIRDFSTEIETFVDSRRSVGETSFLETEGDPRRWAKYGIELSQHVTPD